MKSSNNKVLFIDDEQKVLDGVRRALYKNYEVVTAASGEEGLQKIVDEGPFAVVVSDLRMPEMDGIEFLSTIKQRFPNIVRLIFSGKADLRSAVTAVNAGHVFRFLTKPCSWQELQEALRDSVEYYHLMEAERELLEETLQGSVNVLTDILALTNPVAFSRASRIAYVARQLTARLHLPERWRIEIAAMLSQIGCVTIPPDILEKFYTNQHLTMRERKMVRTYPIVGHDLIAAIPRLDAVAEMIKDQRNDFIPSEEAEEDIMGKDPVTLGAEILRVAIDYDSFLFRGLSEEEAVREMNKKKKAYNPLLLALLEQIAPPFIEKKITTVSVDKLRRGMILAEDVRSVTGVLLARRDQEITVTMRIMFENYHKQGNLFANILVAIPVYTEGE